MKVQPVSRFPDERQHEFLIPGFGAFVEQIKPLIWSRQPNEGQTNDTAINTTNPRPARPSRTRHATSSQSPFTRAPYPGHG